MEQSMSVGMRELDLSSIELQSGAHEADGPNGPYCVMEAVAYS